MFVWRTFSAQAPKIKLLAHGKLLLRGPPFSLSCRRPLFEPKYHVRQAFAGLFVRFLNDVGVNVCGCADLCVSEALRDSDHVFTAVNQN